MTHKNNKIKSALVILLIGMCFAAKAQQAITYTQYMDNLIPINPASSLSSADGAVNIMVRNQWLGIDGAPTLFIFNGSVPLKDIGASYGIIATHSEFGVEQTTEFNGFFAKSVQLSKNLNLGVSINAGFRYYTTAYAELDPNDPAIQNDAKDFRPNAGIGLMLYSSNYYVGLSVPNLTVRKPNNTSLLDNNNFRNNYYLAAGYNTDLDEDFKLKTATLLYYSRGIPFTADVSTKICIKETLGIGVNYRTTHEVATLLSMDMDMFRIGYSYQFGISPANIGQFSNATHQIMLTFLLGNSNRKPVNPGNR